jgi:D-methionine transport system ATP-binding protein
MNDMIEFKNVYKTYNNGEVVALNDVTFTVQPGRILGILGLSGAGKTTILKLISGLEYANSGKITVAGKEVCRDFTEDYRDDMSIVFQGYNLLMQSSVFDNIAFPLKIRKMAKDRIDELVREWAGKMGVSEKLREYPSKLSGGQKQRVAIARALVTNPKILLLDEPTSALDPITTRGILSILKLLNEKNQITIVIITHDINVVRSICDDAVVVNNGEIIGQGSLNDIMNLDNDLIKELFRGKVA